MAYHQFTISEVKKKLGITIREGDRFLPDIPPVTPGDYISQFLQQSLPLATTTSSEKARSELIISPILLEVWRLMNRQVSIFSGEDFEVDASLGLNGRCDFLISRSPELLEIEAPCVVIIEAKRADLKSGIGQCIAEMVAAQKFNLNHLNSTKTIYGSVSNGTQWRFLELVDNTVNIDLHDYALPPVDQILGFLIWMTQNA
jgi:hypothetical protein